MVINRKKEIFELQKRLRGLRGEKRVLLEKIAELQLKMELRTDTLIEIAKQFGWKESDFRSMLERLDTEVL